MHACMQGEDFHITGCHSPLPSSSTTYSSSTSMNSMPAGASPCAGGFVDMHEGFVPKGAQWLQCTSPAGRHACMALSHHPDQLDPRAPANLLLLGTCWTTHDCYAGTTYPESHTCAPMHWKALV